MKRIALVIPSLKSGGAERVVSIWSSELSRLNDQIYLIILYKTENEYETYGNVKKIHLHNSYWESKNSSIPSKVKKIRRALIDNKIDVAIPFITYIGLMTTAACAFSKTKVVETIRNDPKHMPKNKLERIFRNISVLLAKKCIVQNEDQKRYFSSVVQKKIEVFPNPLHPSVTSVSKVYKHTESLVLANVGRLEKQKNQKLLCSAFALASEKCPGISLKIYGMGSMYDELQQHINNLGMQEKIILCGKTGNVAEALAEADIFVLSSDFEGMPNALMEAMAVGLPCISTDCPTGPADMIVSGQNGILVPTNDAYSMADAIVKIAKDYPSAVEMGKEARKFAFNQYEATESSKRLSEFIEKM